MALPKKKTWGGTLADHHGVWCCYCFKYISPSKFNAHHILRQDWVRKRFGPRFPLGPVAPVHCGDCHQGRMQRYADAATEHLRRIIDDKLYDAQARDLLAKRAHDQGVYWVSTLINLDTVKALAVQDRRDEMLTSAEFMLASAAGTRGLRSLSSFLPLRSDEWEQPGILLHQASRAANMGFQPRARALLRTFEDKYPKPGDRLVGSYYLRKAQIGRIASDAQEALRVVNSDYSKTTALLLDSQIRQAEGGRGGRNRAKEQLESILSGGDKVSWLYRATCWLNLACQILDREILTKNILREVYKLLVKAQYVFVMLGLQGTPQPGVLVRANIPEYTLTPGDILVSMDVFAGFSRAECLDMRRIAIAGERLDDRMIVALTDWWHSVIKEMPMI